MSLDDLSNIGKGGLSMQRNIMKSFIKVAVLGSMIVAGTNAMSPDDALLKKLTTDFEKLEWKVGVNPTTISAPVFIEEMGNNIKKAVHDVIAIVVDFIEPKDESETFTQYIQRCKELADAIDTNIVKPFDKGVACYAGDPLHPAVVNTGKLVKDLYQKMFAIYSKLHEHRYGTPGKPAQPNNAVKLVGAIQGPLLAIASVPTIDKLGNDLAVIRDLLIINGVTTVAVDINDLCTLLGFIKTKISAAQKDINIEILNKVRRRLKKL